VGTFPFRFTGEQLGGNTAAVITPAFSWMCLQIKKMTQWAQLVQAHETGRRKKSRVSRHVKYGLVSYICSSCLSAGLSAKPLFEMTCTVSTAGQQEIAWSMWWLHSPLYAVTVQQP
jgi:hypothetical protein